MARVIDNDKGWKKIAQAVLRSKDVIANVGVQNSPSPRDGGSSVSNLDLAIIHEFGTDTVPERSFIRSSFDEHRPEYSRMLNRGGKQILDGKLDAETVVGVIGEKCLSDVKRKIDDGIPPPNRPSTIAKKGSSKPLIDTAQLKNSLTVVVSAGEKT